MQHRADAVSDGRAGARGTRPRARSALCLRPGVADHLTRSAAWPLPALEQRLKRACSRAGQPARPIAARVRTRAAHARRARGPRARDAALKPVASAVDRRARPARSGRARDGDVSVAARRRVLLAVRRSVRERRAVEVIPAVVLRERALDAVDDRARRGASDRDDRGVREVANGVRTRGDRDRARRVLAADEHRARASERRGIIDDRGVAAVSRVTNVRHALHVPRIACVRRGGRR